MVNRIKLVKSCLDKWGISALLVSNPVNIFYLSGFLGLAPDEREAWMLITKTNAYFFTDGRYLNKAQNSNVKGQNFLIQEIYFTKNIQMGVQSITKKEKLERIGFEGEDMTFAEYEKFKELMNLTPTDRLIVRLRQDKDPEEITKIKKACALGDRALQDLITTIKIGQTEKEIAQKLIRLIEKNGAEPAFYPIVAVDESTSSPHYDTKTNGKLKIQKNSVILIDFGVRYQNYCSDITRIFFCGKPKSEIINVYQKLLEIQNNSINRLIDQSKAKEIDKYCRESLEKKKLPNFPHSTGHGIGLQVHEYPKISAVSNDILTKNQVFTIEPGIYLPEKWGLRIEDTVVMKADKKPEVLTKFKKDVFIINN